jgi:hypothetical protein
MNVLGMTSLSSATTEHDKSKVDFIRRVFRKHTAYKTGDGYLRKLPWNSPYWEGISRLACQKLTDSDGTQTFIAMFTKAYHWPLS